MLSQIGPIHFFCFPYFHKAGSSTTGLLQDFYFCLPFFTREETNKQLPCLADSYITHWFELLYKILLILYCEDLQQGCQGNMYFLLHAPTKSRSRFIKK